MRTSVKVTIFAIAASLGGTLSFTQGCSPGKQWEEGTRGPASVSTTYVEGSGGTVVPVTATKVAAVTNVGNMLDHISSMHGIQTPSAAARASYDANRSRVSETGTADSVTPPMWLAITNVAGTSCNDLILKEVALADAQRAFFKGVNFGAGPDAVKASSAVIDRVVRSFARATWGRDEESLELDLIRSSANSQFSGTSGTQTRYMMKYICAAITASLDAHDH